MSRSANRNESMRLSGSSVESVPRVSMYGSLDSFNVQSLSTSTWTLQMEELRLLQRQKRVVLSTLFICLGMIGAGLGIPILNLMI
ncbi:hypothetical protein WDU94_008764 [Cyamophila willieti]